jgi:hypothetical protein
MSKAYDRALAFLDDALGDLDAAPVSTSSVRPPRPVREPRHSADREHDGGGDRQGFRPR